MGDSGDELVVKGRKVMEQREWRQAENGRVGEAVIIRVEGSKGRVERGGKWE